MFSLHLFYWKIEINANIFLFILFSSQLSCLELQISLNYTVFSFRCWIFNFKAAKTALFQSKSTWKIFLVCCYAARRSSEFFQNTYWNLRGVDLLNKEKWNRLNSIEFPIFHAWSGNLINDVVEADHCVTTQKIPLCSTWQLWDAYDDDNLKSVLTRRNPINSACFSSFFLHIGIHDRVSELFFFVSSEP